MSLDFRFEKHLFLKYFKNDFKIFWKDFLIVMVLYVFRISSCVTSPLDKFFLKYAGGVQIAPLPQNKLPSKRPALLGLIIIPI